MSLFRGSSLGTHCSRGSCLARLSLEAGASSAVCSRAGALERDLTASFQAAWSIHGRQWSLGRSFCLTAANGATSNGRSRAKSRTHRESSAAPESGLSATHVPGSNSQIPLTNSTRRSNPSMAVRIHVTATTASVVDVRQVFGEILGEPFTWESDPPPIRRRFVFFERQPGRSCDKPRSTP